MLIPIVTAAKHNDHLKEVLSRLTDYELIVNIDKTYFGQDAVIFLPHQIDYRGISPAIEKVRAIKDFSAPITTIQLRQFLDTLLVVFKIRALSPIHRNTRVLSRNKRKVCPNKLCFPIPETLLSLMVDAAVVTFFSCTSTKRSWIIKTFRGFLEAPRRCSGIKVLL